MRIQELIHLHALLFEVRVYLVQSGEVSPDSFEAYDAQPVRPSHIHRRKDAHETAITLLLEDLDRAIRPASPPEQTLSPTL